jgi:hypothetical protein
VNVGPTFDNPSTGKDDDGLPPRLTSWISKNRHPHGTNPDGTPRDNAKDEDYQKTLFWSIPPRILKGTITQKVPVNGAPPEIVFEGDFWTPRSPNGKDGSKLDDTEKDNLLALLRDEIFAVEERYEFLRSHGLLAAVTENRPSGGMRLAVKLAAPATARVGEAVHPTFSATLAPGVPARVARVDWFTSDGRRFVGEHPSISFGEPGIHTLRVRVRDQWNGEGRAERRIVVRGTPAAKPAQ